ncbi:MAG TPA: Fic family protein [Bacilli bacterium]|nr:Fic family protein [Bacilli bacterium]
MKNKLGLSDDMLAVVENNLVDYKLTLLDEYFTFNENHRGLEYLKKLHSFLFSDLYDNAGELSKDVDSIREQEAEQLLSNIYESIGYLDYSEALIIINESIKDIRDMQIFNDGNARTIYAFVMVAMKDHQVATHQLVCSEERRNFEISMRTNQERR